MVDYKKRHSAAVTRKFPLIKVKLYLGYLNIRNSYYCTLHNLQFKNKNITDTKYGCPECCVIAKRKLRDLARLTKFKKHKLKIESRLPNIVVTMGEYREGTSIKNKYYCKIHKLHRFIRPSDSENNPHLCKVCALENRDNSGHIRAGKSRRRTFKSLVKQLKKQHPHLNVLSKKSIKDKRVKVECTKCDTTRYAFFGDMFASVTGCSICGRLLASSKTKRSKTYYAKRLKKNNSNAILIGDYINDSTDTLHKCKVCNTKYLGKPCNVLYNMYSGCPTCFAKTKRVFASYSGIAILWLRERARLDKVRIRHAENHGEYRIKGSNGNWYHVDGFCIKTNTIYEFYGDCWHGNQKVYKPRQQPNPYSDMTAKQLYKGTMAREQMFLDMGYDVVSIWESEYSEGVI